MAKPDAFQGRFNNLNLHKDKVRGKDAEPTSPLARVSLQAAHNHLRAKR